MKKSARLSGILLLLFNGVTATYGGWMLMRYPDGSGLEMPLSVLQDSPFKDFLIPGIILFVANGLSSLAIAWLVVLRVSHYEKLLMLQGIILMGWIIIQVILVQFVSYLHVLCIGIGLLMVATGLLLFRKNVVT